MNATLVLSVISFSGHVSAPKSFSSESTRTELKQTRWIARERTVRFTTIHDVCGHSKFFDQPGDFCYSRFQYEREIAVTLKVNLRSYTIDNKQFLIHFFNYNSEASVINALRG
ncbi:MAG TPA: hypothetical protein VF141_00095 [Chryseolinea sp.]